MKKIFAFIFSTVLLVAFSVEVKAQFETPYTTSTTKTITTADTINMTSIKGGVVMFEYNLTKTSGTVAGKVYLEGKFLNAWVPLDSLTLADVATLQTLRNIPTQTSYLSYRWRCTNTNSATAAVVAGYLRRPGVK